MAKNYRLNVGGELREVSIEDAGEGRFVARVDDAEYSVVLESLDDNTLFRLRIDGRRTPVAIKRDGYSLDLFIGPDHYEVGIERSAARTFDTITPAIAGEVRIKALMTGKVSEVLVAAGDEVQENDPLLVIVAMKMNNEIRSPAAGTITEVLVAADSMVEQGELLLVMQAGEA
jgi:biotin carboxyl carrier protein